MTEKVRVFISHISEEAEVAGRLKEWIEADTFGLVGAFASSDIYGIEVGAEWLPAIMSALGEAGLVVVLCSPASLTRPWVNFEIGAASMRGAPIIPLCHSGLGAADLPLPLALYHAIELGSPTGLQKLYQRIGRKLGLGRTFGVPALDDKLAEIHRQEDRFREQQERHDFERWIDLVLPRPGRLAGATVPPRTRVESNDVSLQLFGLWGRNRTWADICVAAQVNPDRRWLAQLEDCVARASRGDAFEPVQAIFHAPGGSYQPHLVRRDPTTEGGARLHVQFVPTVSAPLFDVDNEFGLLATLQRLGLRFRYEVLRRFQLKLTGGVPPARLRDEVLQPLRQAIETIEMDARSRGAENVGRGEVVAAFADPGQRSRVRAAHDRWETARMTLFHDDPQAADAASIAALLAEMRAANFELMRLTAGRFHEMLERDWAEPPATA
jgi:hypothetical protein